MQLLSSLLEQISYESVRGDDGLRITDICYHSGKVSESSLFVCIKGQNSDGHDYIEDALKKGARAFVIHKNRKDIAEALWRKYGLLGNDGQTGYASSAQACKRCYQIPIC